jgi:hypothetical protein
VLEGRGWTEQVFRVWFEFMRTFNDMDEIDPRKYAISRKQVRYARGDQRARMALLPRSSGVHGSVVGGCGGMMIVSVVRSSCAWREEWFAVGWWWDDGIHHVVWCVFFPSRWRWG